MGYISQEVQGEQFRLKFNFSLIFRVLCSAGTFRRGQRASKRVRECGVMCWQAHHHQKVSFLIKIRVFIDFSMFFKFCTARERFGAVGGYSNDPGSIG
jgi:hypothetical protein